MKLSFSVNKRFRASRIKLWTLDFGLWTFSAFAFMAIPTFFLDVSAQQTGGERPRQVAVSPSPTPPKPITVMKTVTPNPTPIIARPSLTPPATPEPTPEDDGGVITVESNEVPLNIRIVDRNGRSVTDVKADKSEFQIFENNVLQPITTISREEVPINYGLVIDNSGSLRTQLEKVIEAGKIIVNSNKPGDETFLVRFIDSDNIKILQDFTPKKEELNDALEEMYVEGGQTAVRDAIFLATERANEYENKRNPDDKKRRAIVLVTDGDDRRSFYDEKTLFDFLRESDVQIFVVGFVNELTEEKSLFGKSPKQKSVAFLNKLASDTGGKAYFPNDTSELAGIAKEIASELRTQYILSYEPTNDKKDGTYRAIRVTVRDDAKRGKRIAVTRAGYTAKFDKNDAPVLSKPTPKK